jgi:diguanylate cyclase (GGDEF)-like protein/PAS domain S-box-containing protein
MRILSRLRLLSAIVLAALLALGALLSWSLAEFDAAAANDALVQDIYDNLFDASSLRDEYFLYRDERAKRQWAAKNADAQRLIGRALRQFPDPGARATLGELKRRIEDGAGVFRRIVDAGAARAPGAERAIQDEFEKRLLSQLLVKSSVIHDTINDLHASATERVERAYARLVASIALGALILVLILVSTLYFVARLIRTRLSGLHAGAKVVAGGRLDFKLDCGGGDELAEVAQSINFMTDRLQRTAALLEVELAERKQAERALAEFNRDFENFLDQATDFIYFKDAAGRFRFCSQTMANITGHASWRDMIGKHDRDVFPPELARVYEDEEQPIYGAGQPLLNRIDPYRDGAGAPGFVQTNKWPLFDERGQVTGIFGISRDITEQKRNEARLQLAASVFTHAREGIVITAADGTIVEVNDTFSRITGYPRDEVLGRNPRMLQSGRQGADYYAAMWAALRENGYWCGEIWNRRKNGAVYAEMITISAVCDAAGAVQNYVALFTDITPIKDHQQQLERIAHYDALTGLPNRVLLADRLRQAIVQSQRRRQSLAVVYLDLDGFKAINDGYGHEAGDELLVVAARRMQDALREGDTIARIGGDEFVAVLVDLQRPRDCEPVLARLLTAAAEPVMVGPHRLQVSASIGVTLYPQDGADADLLMRHADQAMYLAKQSGKNRYHLFDVSQDEATKLRHEGVEQIRRGLGLGQFELFYQPKVDMHSGAVVGAEALIRWRHPQRGLLAPAEFLPVIENHPLSVDLGEWVLARALGQMSEWKAAGFQLAVSVNIGARQLQQDDFPVRLAKLLAAHPEVKPGELELEILETSALEDIAKVSKVMHACNALGVPFALDDFGTGYSSLTYLKHLPAELLKIDQSFVRDMLDDPDDLAIVEAVIGLATAFRRNVIAEGVETAAHGALLCRLGCRLAQGYGVARPMPAADLPAWAASWRPDPSWA